MADVFRSVPDSASLQATYHDPLDSPAPARQWLTGLLTGEGVASRTLEDAILVTSELVTNALIHGGGAPSLSVTLTSDAVKIAVTDESVVATRDAMRVAAPGPPSASGGAGGFGLRIVERLALTWGVVPLRAGKTVWAVLPRSSR
jgi:anti-sigma regulatory factor (Ser/Thr protein kinase)